MPKGIHKDGTPNKPPGKNKDPTLKKRGPFWFDGEVNAILDNLPTGVTITEYVSEAIKGKHYRESNK